MHPIDTQKIELLKKLATDNSSLIIFMRHGVQNTKDSDNKIQMMQLPQNQTDHTTAESLFNAEVIAKTIASIADKTQKHVSIHSSKTIRAAVIAQVLENNIAIKADYDDRLSSVNYRKDISDEEIEKMLGNTEGVLPWDEEIVDSVCDSGKGTFRKITQTVKQIFETQFVTNTITVIITHSQQINAASILAGLEPFRLPQLGMIVFFRNRENIIAEQFPHAVFQIDKE